MSNRIHFSFSAEGSGHDPWVLDLVNYFRITLEKITLFPFEITSGPDQNAKEGMQLREANLLILVFNGFISDSFAGDLKIMESDEWKNNGNEVFIVIKSGRFNSIVPGYLRNCSQYNFFQINTRTNEVIDFSPFVKGEKENRFWSVLTDLAFDAKLFFEKLNHQPDRNSLTIYLAETSRDQSAHREILKREFLLSGINVVPLKPLPGTFKEYQDTVREIMSTADISVHIMGETYGDSPAGSDYSFPEIQNKIISELNRQPGHDRFYRFVWLPPYLEPYDEKQIQYLKRLRKELNDHGRGEIIQCSIEEFKEIVFHKIKQLSGLSVHNRIDGSCGKVVLITDDSGKTIFQKVENMVRMVTNDYELIDMSQAGDLFPPALFRHKLQLSEKAVIVNCRGNLNWMQAMLGLSVRNIFNGNNQAGKSIAAVTSLRHDVTDYQKLNVEFFSMEDNRLLKNIENFLTQKD